MLNFHVSYYGTPCINSIYDVVDFLLRLWTIFYCVSKNVDNNLLKNLVTRHDLVNPTSSRKDWWINWWSLHTTFNPPSCNSLSAEINLCSCLNSKNATVELNWEKLFFLSFLVLPSQNSHFAHIYLVLVNCLEEKDSGIVYLAPIWTKLASFWSSNTGSKAS